MSKFGWTLRIFGFIMFIFSSIILLVIMNYSINHKVLTPFLEDAIYICYGLPVWLIFAFWSEDKEELTK